MSEERINEIRQRLSDISDELENVAIDYLRTAVEDGAKSRPPEEKPLMAARRAVLKAVKTLEFGQ